MLNVGNLGPRWTHLVKLWYERKEDAGFKQTGRLPDPQNSRPDAIAAWAKNARKAHWRPKTIDITQYCETWWRWWLSLQPDWRNQGKPREPLRVFPKDVDSGWEWSKCMGSNGVLQILAALFFWQDACLKAGRVRLGVDNEWNGTVEDVIWVLEHLDNISAYNIPMFQVN